LKHCAANRKRRISALPNVGPYIHDVKISGFTRSSIYVVCLKSSMNGTTKQTKQKIQTNKVNLFVSSVLFVFWYHSSNFLDTPHTVSAKLVD
jgi:hypothetical protein